MALYCIADMHLSLSASKPMDIFGNRWLDYTEKLLKCWNKVVSENDTVVIPGDISWAMTLNEAASDLLFINELNGKKIMMKGNHDYWWQSLKKINGFFSQNNLQTISLLQNNAFVLENKILCGSRGWFYDPKTAALNTDYQKIMSREAIRTEISFQKALQLKKDSDLEIIAFFHFPPVYKDFVSREIVDLMKKYGINRCFYGHVHGNYDIPQTINFENIDMTLVSADYLNFIPLLIV